MDNYIGEIRMFAGGFAPEGWVFCNGGTLNINKHMALYSLLGDKYGPSTREVFCVPDLRSRIPIHYGQGPSFPDYSIGAQAGSENVTTERRAMPNHYKAREAQQFTSVTGNNYSVIQPVIAVNFIIAYDGYFPGRDWS
jgi:microcystin-dependent protein